MILFYLFKKFIIKHVIIVSFRCLKISIFCFLMGDILIIMVLANIYKYLNERN